MSDKPKVRPPFVHGESSAKPEPVQKPKTESWPRAPLAGFDWKSAASLRAPSSPGEKADRAWASTDWEERAPAVSEEARRVAEQIDAVVHKIRTGELNIDGKAPTPETAMAAALEALIRSR